MAAIREKYKKVMQHFLPKPDMMQSLPIKIAKTPIIFLNFSLPSKFDIPSLCKLNANSPEILNPTSA